MRGQIIHANIVLQDGILRDGVCGYCDGMIDHVGLMEIGWAKASSRLENSLSNWRISSIILLTVKKLR